MLVRVDILAIAGIWCKWGQLTILRQLSRGMILAGDNIIYDEGDVRQYELPELLVCEHGKPVNDKASWQHHRRQELVGLFEQHRTQSVTAGSAMERT